MNLELVGALNELERERGISKEILFEAIEAAILSAFKRHYGSAQSVRVDMNEKTGQIEVYAQKDVAAEVEDENLQMSLEEAKKIDPNYEVGDTVDIEVTPKDFGRIAAQTAKQVVIQRIREAERALIYDEFSNREGDILTGIVQRSDQRNVLVDLGKVEAVMPPSEQMSAETYKHGDRIKVYLTEVRKTTKGPQVFVSRTHPGLVKRLFELEVPEIYDGIVEIMAASREAGNRSKIAVYSHDPNVDPVGACVGPRGMRVQTVVHELRGEKIDIVAWSSDAKIFIGNALSPAKVVDVYTNTGEKVARAVVPDNQLSLAIGKEGQNARLAARMTGWKIDIKSQAQMAELAFLEGQRKREEDLRKAETGSGPEVKEEPRQAAKAPVEKPIRGESEAGVPEEVSPEEKPAAENQAAARKRPGLDAELFERLQREFQARAAKAEKEDEADPEEPVKPEVPTKPKKSRAAKKAEVRDLVDEVEEVLENEESLPTLFGEEGEEDADEVKPEELIFTTEDEEEQSDADGKEAESAAEQKRKVLKDFSELASLFKDDEEEDAGDEK